MKTQLSGGLEPTKYKGRAKDARPSKSFEEYTLCPYNAGNLSYLIAWKKIGGGGVMTHYHECGEPCCDVPSNTRGGGGYARTGQAYIDNTMWFDNEAVFPLFSEGNFLGTLLSQPLEIGKKYDVIFYLSLLDSVWYAGKNIGAHFSYGQPDGEIENLLSILPQVRYEGDFLTDKEGWMEVSGSFIAQGGEDFITIGNFDGYHNSETILVGGAIPPPNLPHFWTLAAYYIDDVSVVEDRSIGMEETGNGIFRFYPNPAYDAVTVEVEHGKAVVFSDLSGRKVFQSLLQSSKETINIRHLPGGLYTVNVTMQDGSVLRQRLVKQ
jgi:hypothetical protein